MSHSYLVNLYLQFFYELRRTKAYADINAPGPFKVTLNYFCRRKLVKKNACHRMNARLDKLKAFALVFLHFFYVLDTPCDPSHDPSSCCVITLYNRLLKERIPAVDQHFPTGTSVKSMTQFVQNIRGVSVLLESKFKC